MSQIIKLKNSQTPSAVPTAGDLILGEVAVNTYEGWLHYKKNDGSDEILTLDPAAIEAAQASADNALSVAQSKVAPDELGDYATYSVDSFSDLIAGLPVTLQVGDTVTTGLTVWEIVSTVTPVAIVGGLYAKPLNKLYISDFGADRTGVVEATAAWQQAYDLGDQFAPKVSVKMASGTYRVGELTMKAGVGTYGVGKNDVRLVPAGDTIQIFKLDLGTGGGANLDMVGFSIQSDTNTGVKGVLGIGCNRLNLFDIGFFGCEENFRLDLGGWNRVINCETSGGATTPSGYFWVGSSDDSEYGCVFSVIENYQIRVTGTGSADPACVFRRAVALKITNLIASSQEFTGTMALVENDCQGLMFTDCSSVGFGIGLWMRKGSGIDKSPIFNNFNNFEFDQNSTNAVLLEAGINNRFISCPVTSSFVGTDTQAIVIKPDGIQNRFFGCHVTGYFDAGGVGWLFEGADGNVLDHCVVSGCETGVTANGLGHSNNKLISCDFSNDISGFAVTGDWTNAGNKFINLQGTLPASVTAPAVPTSGVAQSNPYPVDARLFIQPNTLISFEINGGTVVPWTTPLDIVLRAGETITLFYTGIAPTWTWVASQ
ncbi:hypothetical protein PODOV061v2_0021 [Vibrio phage 172P1]|nr:hypothetical protein PODOV061v2_0021 [Vibrio phage 172P1]